MVTHKARSDKQRRRRERQGARHIFTTGRTDEIFELTQIGQSSERITPSRTIELSDTFEGVGNLSGDNFYDPAMMLIETLRRG